MTNQSSFKDSRFEHLPVLANEVLEAINNLPKNLLEGGLAIDTTVGGGGHSYLLLNQYKNLHLIGIDQDPNAREAASRKLMEFKNRYKIIGKNFADFVPREKAIFVLADLGVSSHQLDNAERGFSFRNNGPLDMRMNPKQEKTAAQLLQELDEKTLADLIYEFGEERYSRKIARRIKADLREYGPYEGTLALSYAIAGCYPPKFRHGRLHPATRTFQALRIAVNGELQVLDRLLNVAPEWLHPGGILCVISFHSLEDRMVKKAFINNNQLQRLTRKPIIAKEEEKLANPRSRSAKMRLSMRK